MKKKKLIISAVGLLFSIFLMAFGVYSASNPSLTVTGTVTYTVMDAKVLVRGRIEDALSFGGKEPVHADSYSAMDLYNYTSSPKINTASQYLSYTKGGAANNEDDQLEDWEYGDISFEETSKGTQQIKMYIEVYNYSVYPVNVSLTFSQTEEQLAQKNVLRNVSATTFDLNEVDGYKPSQEIVITYDVINAGQKIEKIDISGNLQIKQTTDVLEPEETKENWSGRYDSELEGLVLTSYSGNVTDIVIPKTLDTTTLLSYDRSELSQVSSNTNGLNLSKYADSDILPVVGVEGNLAALQPLLLNFAQVTSIYIPSTIKSIGVGTFALTGCQNATDVLTTNANPIFHDKGVTVYFQKQSQIEEFGPAVFALSAVKRINLPYGITSLDSTTLNGVELGTFSACFNLTYISIPESVTNIGDYAFDACDGLESVIIPDSVTNIGNNAFESCGSLKNITIPESVITIEPNAFRYCSSLTSVMFADPTGTWNVNGNDISVAKASVNATNLKSTYSEYVWSRNERQETLENWSGRYDSDLEGLVLTSYSGSVKDIVIPRELDTANLANYTGTAGVYKVVGVEGDLENLQPLLLNFADVTSIYIPSTIEYIGVGAFAFTGCQNLESVMSVGSNPVYHEQGVAVAFQKGTKLTHFGPGVFALSGVTGVNIPEGVTTLDSVQEVGVFQYCYNLEFVTIPETVTNIGEQAFNHCIALASVTIPEGVTNIGDMAFNWCEKLETVKIPDAVTTLGERAFYGCDNLTSVTIGKGLTSIGANAFTACYSLESAVFADRVSTWVVEDEILSVVKADISATYLSSTYNSYAWNKNDIEETREGWSGRYDNALGGLVLTSYSGDETDIVIPRQLDTRMLEQYQGTHDIYTVVGVEGNLDQLQPLLLNFEDITSVYIQNTIKYIGDLAFALIGCTNSAEIFANRDLPIYTENDIPVEFQLGTELQHFGEGVFTLSGITSINLPNGNYKLQSTDYQGQTVGAFWLCSKLNEISIPDGVTEIGDNAFELCTLLKNVTIGNGVETIGNYAFWNCSAIETVTFGENLESIGSYAFNSCELIETVTIPEFVTFIGQYAFDECSALSSVVFENPELIWLVNNEKIAVYVPETNATNLKTTYVSYDWTVGKLETTEGWSAKYDLDLGGLVLTNYSGTETKIYIPNELDTAELEDYVGVEGVFPVVGIEGDVENMVPVFENAAQITHIKIPASMKSIGEAGLACVGTNYIDIMNGVVTPDQFSLEEVTFEFEENSQLEVIGQMAFGLAAISGIIEIPASVKTIEQTAFAAAGSNFMLIMEEVISAEKYETTNFEVQFQENSQLEVIGEMAFAYSGLGGNFEIPANVTTIGEMTFGMAGTNLPLSLFGMIETEDVQYSNINLTFEENGKLRIIPNQFAYFSGVTSVVIPDFITTIDEQAFMYSIGMTSAEFADPTAKWIVDGEEVAVDNPSTNATNLTQTYAGYAWACNTIETVIGWSARYDSDLEGLVLTNYTGTETNIVIPKQLNTGVLESYSGSEGVYPVVGLEGDMDNPSSALGTNIANITSIYIPSTLKYIGEASFIAVGTNMFDIMAGTATTDQFTMGQVAITFEENSQLEIIGEMAFAMTALSGDVIIPASVSTLADMAFASVGSNVYLILDGALPESALALNEINLTFEDGSKLKSIPYMAFLATGLKSIEIPDSVTEIGTQAFMFSINLTNITFGKSLSLIGEMAFTYCQALTSAVFEDTTVTWIANGEEISVADPSVNVTNLVTEYSNYSWANNKNETVLGWSGKYDDTLEGIVLTNYTGTETHIVIPRNLDTDLLESYSGSTSGYLPVVGIEGNGSSALGSNIANVKSIYIPSTLKSIGEAAFAFVGTNFTEIMAGTATTEQFDMKEVSIIFEENSKLETIGSMAFGLAALSGDIKIPASVTTIQNQAFMSVANNALLALQGAIPEDKFKCNDLTISFEENSKLTQINNETFLYAGMSSLQIPEGVTSIGDTAFGLCFNLKTLTIPASVTSIGASTFENCMFLESVVFADATSTWTVNSQTVSVNNHKENAQNLISNYSSYAWTKNTKQETTSNWSGRYDSALGGIVLTKYTGSETDIIIPREIYTGNLETYEGNLSNTYPVVGIEGNIDTLQPLLLNTTNITSVYVPNTVKFIGDITFALLGCTNLSEVLSLTAGPVFTDANIAINFEQGTQLIYVGKGAFIMAGITEINLPNGYYELKGFEYEQQLFGAFYMCSKLTKIIIPDGVEKIGDLTFAYCNSLESVTIGESVKHIGQGAFVCPALNEINFNATAMEDMTANNNAFAAAGYSGYGITVNIGENVTKIPAHLFNSCEDTAEYMPKISVVKFAKNGICESIGAYAFANCSNLEVLEISESVSEIKENAFASCAKLHTAVFVDAVSKWTVNNQIVSVQNEKINAENLASTYVGYVWTKNEKQEELSDWSGRYDSDLGGLVLTSYAGTKTDVVIPRELDTTTIADYEGPAGVLTVVGLEGDLENLQPLLLNYEDITSVYVPNTVKYIGDVTFALSGCTNYQEVLLNGKEPVFTDADISIVFEAGTVLDQMGAGVFALSGITSVNLPQGNYTLNYVEFQDIPVGAFIMNTKLRSITIPGTVVIGSYAFALCMSLDSVTLEEGTLMVGSYAFMECMSLKTITLPSTLTIIGENAFAAPIIEVTNLSMLPLEIGSSDNGGVASFAKNIRTSKNDPSYIVTDENGYQFYENGTDVYLIAYKGAESEIVLPETSPGGSSYNLYMAAFYMNNTITSVTISSGVIDMGYITFNACKNLTTVIIGENVTYAGEETLNGCPKLTSVILLCETPPSYNLSVPMGTDISVTVYVPASDDDSIINAYKQAQGWSGHNLQEIQ